jgi:hypothetical protein
MDFVTMMQLFDEVSSKQTGQTRRHSRSDDN